MESMAQGMSVSHSTPRRGWRRFFRRRYRYRVTAQGFLFIVLTIALGFAAVNTGSNMTFLFLSLMLALLTISSVVAPVSIWRLSVERVAPRHIHAGDDVPITLIIANRKPFVSSYSLRAVDLLDTREAAGECYTLQVRPWERVESSYITRFNRRGAYRFGSTQIISTHPYGFFSRRIDLSCESEILVYPQVLGVAEWKSHAPAPLGELESPRKGIGSELYDLRDYREGDSARAIHWKVSARTGRLVAREFESEEKRFITLLLDNGVPEPGDAEMAAHFERGIVACASLAHAYLDRGFQVELITRSGRVPMSQGRSHLLRLLRSLALVELVRHDGPPLWLPPPSGEVAQIAVQYLPGLAQIEDDNVKVFEVQKTPAFADLEFLPVVSPASHGRERPAEKRRRKKRMRKQAEAN